MTTKTNIGLVEHAIKWLGQKYWYGTYCNDCTMEKYLAKKKQYPSHYGSSRTSQYMQDISQRKKCADCVGLIKGYYWTNDEGRIVYKLDGRPDTSANGMYNKCTVKGDISKMPDVPGMLVFYPGHVGIYIGNGDVIEARGFNYGVVKTKLRERAWKTYGQCPYIEYVTATEPVQPPVNPTLRENIKGLDDKIKHLQSLLTSKGFPLVIDGKFGSKTLSAVCQYQESRGLEVDGIVGPKTWASLIADQPAQATYEIRAQTTSKQTADLIAEFIRNQNVTVEITPRT